MNERDELADKIEVAAPISAGDAESIADAILEAGYRKPRTITTAEELRDLEVESIVRGKWLAEKWADPEGEVWHVVGKGMIWDSEQLIQRGGLPATVLWEPR